MRLVALTSDLTALIIINIGSAFAFKTLLFEKTLFRRLRRLVYLLNYYGQAIDRAGDRICSHHRAADIVGGLVDGGVEGSLAVMDREVFALMALPISASLSVTYLDICRSLVGMSKVMRSSGSSHASL